MPYPPSCPTRDECVSRDPGPAPTTEHGSRRLAGPLFHLDKLKRLAQLRRVMFVTPHATKKLEDLQWSAADFCRCICAVPATKYRNSEWARSSGGSWIACDVYAFAYNEGTGDVVENGDRRATIHLYIKCGLGASGDPIILVCSVHP